MVDSLEERLNVARRLLRMEEPEEFFSQICDLNNFNVNLLYGYVRSFVRLAYLGDVSVAAKDLGMTRQSIKRHIHELENLLECELFEHVGAQSKLSERGILWMPRAQEFFELARVFLNRRGISRAAYQSTQLPLRMLLRDQSNSRLLREFAEAWMRGERAIGCCELAPFHEHCIIYERRSGNWASRSIGAKTAFRQWFGSEIASESQGKSVQEMTTGADLRDEVSFLLDGVYTRGGLHFSEVSCKLTQPNSLDRKPLLYQRVLAELVDEEEKPVVASIIEIISRQTDPAHG